MERARLAKQWVTCIIPTASLAALVGEDYEEKHSTMSMGRCTVKKTSYIQVFSKQRTSALFVDTS